MKFEQMIEAVRAGKVCVRNDVEARYYAGVLQMRCVGTTLWLACPFGITDGWEIKDMRVSAQEAFKALEEGKKLRRALWSACCHIEKGGLGGIVFVNGSSGVSWRPCTQALIANDWLILE